MPHLIIQYTPQLDAETNMAELCQTLSNTMLAATHTPHAPWVCVRANSKKAARIAVISHLLQVLAPKPLLKGVEKPDPKVLFPFEASAVTDGRLAK